MAAGGNSCFGRGTVHHGLNGQLGRLSGRLMAAVGEGDRGLKASGELVAMAGELSVGELSAAVVRVMRVAISSTTISAVAKSPQWAAAGGAIASPMIRQLTALNRPRTPYRPNRYRPREISRKEDTSFNAAPVAAVGWALPTIGETLFEKLPKLDRSESWVITKASNFVGSVLTVAGSGG
jgi:hypothetical protein